MLLIIIPTTWQPLRSPAQILAHSLAANNKRLDILIQHQYQKHSIPKPEASSVTTYLQHKNHPRPLRLTRIPPRMHRRPLHRNIASAQQRLMSIIQNHLNGTLNDNSEIDRLRSVHHAFIAGREIDHAADDPVFLDEAELAGGDDVVVGLDVGVGG